MKSVRKSIDWWLLRLRYRKPLNYYVNLYEASLARIPEAVVSREQASFIFQQRVEATWGLLAKGAEAVPYLLSLINSKSPDAREDASFLLGEIKKTNGIADILLGQLNNETDAVARSIMISALGKLRYEPATPALARLIFREDLDRDTKLDAVGSLDLILKRRFSESKDPVQTAASWLTDQGYTREGFRRSKETVAG